jgi:cytochrome c556
MLRRDSLVLCVSVLVALGALASACVPHRDVPANDVPKLTSLKEVMDVQATVADPQMSKAGQSTYADADWTAFADLASRIQATSTKAKEFSKGPEFDQFADRLNGTAKALGTATEAKDAAGASKALGDMKATCKECHKKFK